MYTPTHPHEQIGIKQNAIKKELKVIGCYFDGKITVWVASNGKDYFVDTEIDALRLCNSLNCSRFGENKENPRYLCNPTRSGLWAVNHIPKDWEA